MVKSLSALSILVAGTLVSGTTNAQFLRGLQDRLVNAVESRVEQNVEQRVMQTLEQEASQAVDASFNAFFTAPGSQAGAGSGSEGASSILSKMFDTSNIAVEEEYLFDIATTFEVQAFDSRGRSEGLTEFVFHYTEDAPYTGTRILSGEGADAGAAMIIYDFDNQVMLMLMDAEGSRFSMAYNWAIGTADWNTAWELPEEGTSADTSDPLQFERIGSRTINGYDSDGYRTTGEDHITEVWVSEDVAPGIERVFQANRTSPLFGNGLPAGYPQGMIMELNSEDTQTGEKVQMRTKSIDTASRVSFRMSDYPLMSFGAQPAP